MSERFRNDRGSPLVFRLQLFLQPDSAYSGPAFTQNPAARGGRLILYHGWNDHLIAPGNTVDYYNAVLYTMGVTRTNESVRLFMAPGMMHCRGGDGTPNFDMIPELENWMVRGRAPDRVVASRNQSGSDAPVVPVSPGGGL